MKRLLLVVLTLGFILGVVADARAEDKSNLKKALSYYHSGKFKEAVKYLGDYVEQSPDPAGYYMLGYALYKLKRFDEAEDFFSQAYLIDPNFSPEHSGLPQRPARKKSPKPAAETAAPSGVTETPGPKAAAAGKMEQKGAEKPAPPPSQKSGPQKTAKSEQAPPAAPVQGTAKAPAAPTTSPPPQAQGVAKVPAPPAASPQGVAPVPAKPESAPQPAPKPPQQVTPQFPPPMKQPPVSIPGMGTGLIGGILAGVGLFFLILGIAIYLFTSYCLYRIAVRLNVPAAWTAWVPVVHLWTIVAAAGKPWWWLLLLFVPLVNIFIGIYLWLCITENLGHNKWLGLLVIPLGVFFIAYLAFAKYSAPAPSSGGVPQEDLT